MGRYNDLLKATFLTPRSWELNEELKFYTKEINRLEMLFLRAIGVNTFATKYDDFEIIVPKVFRTDLASVPRLLWSIIAPTDIARAAVVHDYIYYCIRRYRRMPHAEKKNWKTAKKLGDTIFLDAMCSSDPAVPKWKIYAAYTMVQLFGGSSIKPRKEL